MERPAYCLRIDSRERRSYLENRSTSTLKCGVFVGEFAMKETKDVLRIVGIVLLALFVLVVGIPLVFAAAGITLSIIGTILGLAVWLIKVAVFIAIVYLILVGIRAVLR